MPLQWSIRDARSEDVEELVKLCGEHAEFEKSTVSPDGMASALHEHLFGESPSVQCLVVDTPRGLIGYATYMKQFSTWDAAHYVYMDCLFLRRSARSHGIGVELMRGIERYAVEVGCPQIQWQTPSFNTRAMPFYERMGGSGKEKVRYFLDLSKR